MVWGEEHGPGDPREGHWADERHYGCDSYYHEILVAIVIAEFLLHLLTGSLQ